MGYSPWGHKGSDMPEATEHAHMHEGRGDLSRQGTSIPRKDVVETLLLLSPGLSHHISSDLDLGRSWKSNSGFDKAV